MDFYTDKDGKIESQSDENISIEQQVLNSEKAFETSEAKSKTTTRVLNYLQIYLLLALATLITAVIGISYPYLIQLLANVNFRAAYYTNITLSIIGIVGILFSSIAMGFTARSTHATALSLTCLILMSVCMGITFAPIIMLCTDNDPLYSTTLYMAFGITTVIFIALGLTSSLLKNMKFWVSLLVGLSISLVLIFSVNFILLFTTMLFGSHLLMNMYFWTSIGIQALVSIYILIITMLDFKRISQLMKSNSLDRFSNLTVYCAATLYVDFMNILLRVLLIMAASRRN